MKGCGIGAGNEITIFLLEPDFQSKMTDQQTKLGNLINPFPLFC